MDHKQNGYVINIYYGGGIDNRNDIWMDNGGKERESYIQKRQGMLLTIYCGWINLDGMNIEQRDDIYRER